MSKKFNDAMRALAASRHVDSHSAVMLSYDEAHDTFGAEITVAHDSFDGSGVYGVSFHAVSDATAPTLNSLAEAITGWVGYLTSREAKPEQGETVVTDHGPAPEPTWWWASWVKVHAVPDREESFEVGSTTFDYPAVEFDHSRNRTRAHCRVLATSETDARAKAIQAWREAGFLPVLERAGLEVGE